MNCQNISRSLCSNRVNKHLQKILFFFLVLTGNGVFGQSTDIVFERINTSHGLSNNSVRQVFQDNKGYLWVGTNDGLNKYDGYSFTNYRNDPDDTTSISHNEIWAIYEDSNKDLWIGTKDGLNLYNRGRENFTTYNHTSDDAEYANAVLTPFEDSKGNFWMAAPFKGLTKFNRETKGFTHFAIDSAAGIGNVNVIFDIIEDRDGEGLWLGCYGSGLCYFNFQKEKITKHIHDPKNPTSLSDNRIWEITQSSNGEIWIATESGGLNRFNPESKKFTHFKNDPQKSASLSNNFVQSLFKDPSQENLMWIGTRGGLNLFDPKNNTFTDVFKSEISDQATLSNDFIWDIYKDKSGNLWVGSDGGLDKFDPGRVPFRYFNVVDKKKNWLNDNNVWAITTSKTNPDILWIGTGNGGLNRFDRKKNSFSYFKHDSTDKQSLSNDWVFDVYEDPNEAGEILWIATIGGGLNRFNLKTKKFKNYRRDIEDVNSLSSDNIRNIYKTRDGMLWLTTSSGLNMFDRDKEKFTRYLYQDTTYVAAIQNLLSELATKKSAIASILKVGEAADLTETFKLLKKTQILLVSLGEGLPGPNMVDFGWLENIDSKEIWKFDFESSRHAGGGTKNRMQVWTNTLPAGEYRLRYVSDVGHSYENWNVNAPINPNMWGIQLFEINDSEKKLVTMNMDKFEKPNSIVEDNQYSIIEDSYGMLWVGTATGLSKLDRKTGQFSNYIHDGKNAGSLSNNSIQAMHEDKNGALWIGTQDGLNKYNEKSDSFKRFKVSDGLPNNVIRNILEDKEGNLWLATNNGISKFDPTEGLKNGYLTFINYNIEDGLQYNQYFRSSMHSAEDGELFFGGVNGFISFFPGQVNPQPPRTIISNFLIFNEPVKPGENSPLQKHISETDQITLSFDQNAFSFEFVALHFSRPEKNQYLYKMEGFDKEWTDGSRRFAPYTNLDPGEYTFKVKASNSDGIWNNEGANVSITILPPWWRTIWAYIAYALLLAIGFLGFDRFQRRRLLAKTKERMKIQKAEHRAEAAELEARAAKAENERKSKELEEARSLQLSMLPKELPQLPNLDIAVYMQTATEVGGDYYDFHVGLDGTLTVVIGDATGHGMKAGTMVTTAKSLFNSYAPNPDILFTFSEITRCIRQMNFGKLSMCLTMAKIKGDKLQISTAGMPPSFIFRSDTRVVEEHLFKAMPLGSMDKFPYELKDTTLKPGDTILLMSDGLPELNNDSGEMYGYKRIRNGFEDVAEKSPEEIIGFLKDEGSAWVNDEAPDDDVTFVVIKVK